jgi:hypothetical protein
MSARIVKRGGLAGLLAAALFLITTVIDQVAPVQTVYSPNEYVYWVLSTGAVVAAIGAVVGLQAFLSRNARLRRLGAVAAWLTGIGYGVIALVNVFSMIQGERSLVTVRLAGASALLIGSAMLGVVVLVTRVLPWWCGVLLIIAFPLGDASNAAFRGGEGILLALLWGSVGLALLTRADTSTEPIAA